jgi:hypothetical protein
MVRRANLKPPPTYNSEASASAPPRNADPRAASTGPVGSAVGQIAKIKGCRAVGSAGGAEKCRLLIGEFTFDAAVDHRSATVAGAIRQAVGARQ